MLFNGKYFIWQKYIKREWQKMSKLQKKVRYYQTNNRKRLMKIGGKD